MTHTVTSAKKEVCCINTSNLIRIIKIEQGESVFEDLIQRTGYTESYLTDTNNWISLLDLVKLFAIVKEIYGTKSPKIFYRLGQEITKTESGAIIQIAKLAGAIKKVIASSPEYNKSFNVDQEIEVASIESQEALIINYFYNEYMPQETIDQCEWTRGILSGIPLLFNLPPAELLEISCCFDLFNVLNRDYGYLNLDVREKNIRVFINGEEHAHWVKLEETEVGKKLFLKARKLPDNSKKGTTRIFNKAVGAVTHGYEGVKGLLVTKTFSFDGNDVIKEGVIYNAPYCLYELNWEKLPFFKNLYIQSIGKVISSQSTRKELEKMLSVSRTRLFDEQKAKEELADLNLTLEKKVVERTTELKQTQAKLLESEKRSLEHRITGGFAHKMRNALAGAQLEFKTTLNYQDKGKTSAELLKESATTLLKNISEIHQEFEIPREKIASHFIPELKAIADIAEHLADVHSGVSKDLDRGLSITSQIRDYAKMSEFKTGDTHVDIVPLLTEFAHQYHPEFVEISIQYSVSGLKKAIVKADEMHLNSIFSNLILNAKDALVDSEIEVREISVTIETDNDQLIVKVKDNGPGIKQEHLDEIFEPFFSTKPTSGTGLGLGVVKKLVQLYGGQVDVESKIGVGTTFKITLSGGRNG